MGVNDERDLGCERLGSRHLNRDYVLGFGAVYNAFFQHFPRFFFHFNQAVTRIATLRRKVKGKHSILGLVSVKLECGDVMGQVN